MTKEELEALEKSISESVDGIMQAKLAEVVGPIAAQEARSVVEKMRQEKALFGFDRTGLNDKQKSDFAKAVKDITTPGKFIDTKANEALIEEQDNRGGYLVSTEVANAILRIAASVGLVLSQAQRWPMKTDELGVPNYTGSFLEGEYLEIDAAGDVTGINFGQAKLIIKKWQLAFVVGNDLLADAPVELANWLLALGGEALANMIDKQAFAGSGKPFVGIMESDDVTVKVLASGKNTYEEFSVVDDGSAMIGDLDESILEGAAFYMHRTVWANLRVQKDGNGTYLLPQAGATSAALISMYSTGGGLKPAGEILGFPVFTNRHLPALSTSGASKKFLSFGNMKAMAYGDKGEMRVAQHESGSFGGKEIALADQKGLVYKHRHALTIALAAAFEVAKTAANQ